MTSIIGNKNKFAIEYTFYSGEDSGRNRESWGNLRVWIKDKDICEYTINNEVKKYEWNLINIIEWMCNNLVHVIGFDPFPLPVQGGDILEIIKVADEYETEEEDEMYLWYNAKNSWIFRHSWFNNRDSSILTNVYFRRVSNDIEIAWDNGFFEEQGINFISPKGIINLPIWEFKEIIFNFIYKASEELDNRKYHNEEEKLLLSSLIKKIKIFEPENN